MKETNTRIGAPVAIRADFPEFIRLREAAAMLRVSARTLDRYRSAGGGPAYFAFGHRIVYERADLAAWAAGRRCRDTASAGTP